MGFLKINTNIASMNAHINSVVTNRDLDRSLEKLSSGLRINKAADDSSGMAIADSLRLQANSLGFGANRVRSLPDGIAKALDEYLFIQHWESEAETEENDLEGAPTLPFEDLEIPDPAPRVIGELCPECGMATLVNEEGCRKCYTCGYSEC